MDGNNEKIKKLKNDLKQELEKLEEELRENNDEELEAARQKYERDKELVCYFYFFASILIQLLLSHHLFPVCMI